MPHLASCHYALSESCPSQNRSMVLDPSVTSTRSRMSKPANDSRYPLVGGTRERRFDGTNSKPRKLLKNAATPTSRVHAVLGGIYNPYFRDRFSVSQTNMPFSLMCWTMRCQLHFRNIVGSCKAFCTSV